MEHWSHQSQETPWIVSSQIVVSAETPLESVTMGRPVTGTAKAASSAAQPVTANQEESRPIYAVLE